MDTKSKAEADEALNKALELTFPASDPVSANETDDSSVRPAGRRPAPLDKALVRKLASRVGKRNLTPKKP